MPVLGNALTKVFGSRNDRLLKRYWREVDAINALEPDIQKLTDQQLKDRTAELRKWVQDGHTLRDQIDGHECLHEVFAIMRESMDRHIGIREIFNPEQDFDPNELDDAALEQYDLVQQQMIQGGISWQQVAIPLPVYEAVRKLIPESRPPFRARCFDVQLIGGLVLYEGQIAEMKTGEGKTFVGPLACFAKVVEGKHAHVVTVNDYLVRRDATWTKPAMNNLGVSVGWIEQAMGPAGPARAGAYRCDITYGTSSEFGFDYLRDNMKPTVQHQVQGPLDYAIVDEIDSILIDEARTPLIISGQANMDAPKYAEADAVARKVMELNKGWDQAQDRIDEAKRQIKAAQGDLDLAKDKGEKQTLRAKIEAAETELVKAEDDQQNHTQYYERELDRKSVNLTHEGIAAAQEAAGVGSFYVGENVEWPHLMDQAMRAHVCYELDKDYVVEPDPQTKQPSVVIVDEYTGRKMVGRQWSDGLHQAVEAKEGVPIKKETQTMATITLQNFFKLYEGLSGMTGTAQTEAEEFSKIYQLDVVSIPTNRPVIRDDANDLIFRTEPEKWNALIDDIVEVSDAGRPVLVGTTDVEKSEYLSRMLTKKHSRKHEVLNAKQHERESHIIEQAGQQHQEKGKTVGNVTIATNMAGRGTDIKPTKAAMEAGGLHVIGTERHTARRIDDQLRGRSGRQGDPGSSQFYVSLQDSLMKMFMGEWVVNIFKRIGMGEGEAIEDKRLTKGIERAQKKVEERNFLQRKSLLEYDEVNNIQRTYFYGQRQRVLEDRDVEGIIWEMIGESIDDAVEKYVASDYAAACVAEWVRENLDVNVEPEDFPGRVKKFRDVEDIIRNKARNDVESSLPSTLSEFMGEEPEDVAQWDTKNIALYAERNFGLAMSEEKIRGYDPQRLVDGLLHAAHAKIETFDLTPVEPLLDPAYGPEKLRDFCQQKFGITIEVDEVLADRERNVKRPAEQVVDLIEERARAAYFRREVDYPVEQVIGGVFGQPGGNLEERLAFLKQWSLRKYDHELTDPHLAETSPAQLTDELKGLQEEWLAPDGKLDRWVRATMGGTDGSPAAVAEAFGKRFRLTVPADIFDPVAWNARPRKPGVEYGDEGDDDDITTEQLLHRHARRLLRTELSQLEQYILVQILDASWKDHLYAMDMLKGGIGLQAFAERDPRVAFKRDGMAFFKQFQATVRDKVTDLIFRVRVEGNQQVVDQRGPATRGGVEVDDAAGAST